MDEKLQTMYDLLIEQGESSLENTLKVTVNGYGESLINYNQNVNKFSIGVSISR
jgi:outer membrane phospholipase A